MNEGTIFRCVNDPEKNYLTKRIQELEQELNKRKEIEQVIFLSNF